MMPRFQSCARRVTGLLLLSWSFLCGQASDKNGILTITVTDERGKSFEGETHVEIIGRDFDFKTVIRARGSVPLPFGSYTITAWSSNRGGPRRLVSIARPMTEMVVALSPRELGDNSAPNPWLIRGKILPTPGKGTLVVARLVGLYTDELEDAVVKEDGSFALNAWWIGPYKLWILSEGKRVAERDVQVAFFPKELRPIEIRLSEDGSSKKQ